MHHSFYRIADTLIAVHSRERMSDGDFDIFRREGTDRADIEFVLEDHIDEVDLKVSYNEMNVYWAADTEGNFVIDVYDGNTNSLLVRMFVDRGFTKARIQRSPHTVLTPYEYVFGLFGEIVFRNHILRRGGIVLHAAAINADGKGILFSGPSGMGKTTQAMLWERYMRTHIINSDRPPLMFDKNGILRVHGSAWSGSDKIITTESIPVKAIVFLRQDDENSVSSLSPAEAVQWFIPRAFIPYFDLEMMETAMRNIERILEAADIYLLRCRPDFGAVEALQEALHTAPRHL